MLIGGDKPKAPYVCFHLGEQRSGLISGSACGSPVPEPDLSCFQAVFPLLQTQPLLLKLFQSSTPPKPSPYRRHLCNLVKEACRSVAEGWEPQTEAWVGEQRRKHHFTYKMSAFRTENTGKNAVFLRKAITCPNVGFTSPNSI